MLQTRATKSSDSQYYFVCFSGSNLIVVPKLQIRFISVASITERRPIAHTCGCVLELPAGENGYDSYLNLREEFNSILMSGYLQMDFV